MAKKSRRVDGSQPITKGEAKHIGLPNLAQGSGGMGRRGAKSVKRGTRKKGK